MAITHPLSPTACRVMAKRLRDVCALPESEPLWKAGRGFVVRDWRSGVSAERRHLKTAETFAAVCRRAVTEPENRPPSP
jgi:hypothetical protein